VPVHWIAFAPRTATGFVKLVDRLLCLQAIAERIGAAMKADVALHGAVLGYTVELVGGWLRGYGNGTTVASCERDI
jgi:hypothetical protein